MRLGSETLRDKLAAEYVLGTMPVRTRRRFEMYLRLHPPLRRAVTEWELRLAPFTENVPGIRPPARVWKAVKSRVHGERKAALRFWENLAFWRISSFASALLAVALAVLALAPKPQEAIATGRMVVIMEDVATKRPAMTASWEPHQRGGRMLRIHVIGHAEMAPHTAWELWMLPGGGQNPVSLGLITTHETQFVKVPDSLAARLDAAYGLAMSVEPAGGSPTGSPSGPVLYAGECVRT